jgi:tetratricopeptide (TPR) repeat protein
VRTSRAGGNRAFALSWLSLVFARAGHNVRAIELTDRFFKEVDRAEFGDYGVSLFLEGLGPALVLVERLEQALDMAAAVRDGIARKNAQFSIAETLVREGDLSGALRVCDLMEDHVDYSKTEVLVEAADIVTNIVDLERVAMLAQNRDGFQKMSAPSGLAAAWARLGNFKKASELANQIIGHRPNTSEGTYEKVRYCIRMADAFAQLKDAGKASAIAKQALAIIQNEREKPFWFAGDGQDLWAYRPVQAVEPWQEDDPIVSN